jgi:hypothetical protein
MRIIVWGDDNIIFTKTYDFDGTEERQITIPIDNDQEQVPSAITEINKIISEFSNEKCIKKISWDHQHLQQQTLHKHQHRKTWTRNT